MKYQALFSLKNKFDKIFKTVICCSHDWCLKGLKCTCIFSSFSNIDTVLRRVHEVLSLSLTSGDMIIPSVQIGLLGSITAIIQYPRIGNITGNISLLYLELPINQVFR